MSDPWTVLGLEPSFEIDRAALRAAHLRASAAAHPDTGGGDARATAVINRAREVLADPERRATAYLALLGGASASEDKSLPDGFLMEIMDVRTEIESDLASGGEAGRARWESWAEQRRAEYAERVGGMFRDAGGEPDAGSLAAIRAELNAWRYIERLVEQLDPGYSHGDELGRSGDRGQ